MLSRFKRRAAFLFVFVGLASLAGAGLPAAAAGKSDLPVPAGYTLKVGESTPFRHAFTADIPMDLGKVLAFYRSELGKRGWKEDGKKADVAADHAVVRFAACKGSAVLKLSRANGKTTVDLATRDPEAAKAAGMLPKPGQAKLMLGNALPADAEVSIANKTVKVAAGAGKQEPAPGLTFDLPPGKYPYSIKLAGHPAMTDVVYIGADETWGLMVTPVGGMTIEFY